MTTNARMEFSLIVAIELPDGSTYNLRHVFDSLTVAKDVAAWYKRQPGTKFMTLIEVKIAETFKTVDLDN